MALTLGLKLKMSNLTALIAAVFTTGLQAWHKFTATTWTGSNRLPDSSPVGTNTAALYTGRGLSFDGVNDVVTIGATGVTVKTVVFYAYPDTTTQAFMQLQSTGAVRIEIATGTLSATGFTSPTLYVNGAASSTVAATTWQMIAVTSATGVSASNLLLGQSNTTFYSGDLSNVKMFSTQLNASQIAELYANPEQALPSGASASDLVGWWTMINGANNTIVIDASATKKNGVISGASSLNSGPSPMPQSALNGFSSPMWFDGVDDYISVSNIDLTGDFTIYAIVSNLTLNENHVCGDNSTANTFRLDKAADRLSIRLNSTTYSFTSAGINNNSVHHTVVKRSGTTITGLCNNVNLGTATDSNNFLIQRIGSGYINWFFNGIIHSLAIFSNSLTSDELTTIYNGGNEFDFNTNSGDYVSKANLLGYWKNTGNTNANWIDLSTAGKNGTVNGSPSQVLLPNGTTIGKDILGFTLAKPNTGQILIQTTDYALIADAATLDITSAITLEAWVKPFSVSSTQTIIGKNSAYALNITSGAKLQFQRWSSTSSGTVSSSASITANTWTHVAATYDGTNTKIYINGALDTNSTSISGAIDSTATDVLMGALTSSTQLFSGYIDSAKVYSAALTATQVLTNYSVESTEYA